MSRGRGRSCGRPDTREAWCLTQNSEWRRSVPLSPFSVSQRSTRQLWAWCPVFCFLGPSIPLAPGDTPIRKKDELLFDDGDDIMAALGFGDSPKADRRQTGDQ